MNFTHPTRIHFGPHLPVEHGPRHTFASTLVRHFNECFSQSNRQLELVGFDGADIPADAAETAYMPDQFNIEVYLFSNADHPTRNGTLDGDGHGNIRLIVPCPSLQMAGSPTFYLPAHALVLGTISHEFTHTWRRGEPYRAKFADPPEGVPMPPMNHWAYPNDIYWTQDKRDWILDSFSVNQPIGHPLFKDENQDLDWLLKNMRPSRGTRAIMRRGVRGGAPFSREFTIVANAEKPFFQFWKVPADYRDQWEPETDWHFIAPDNQTVSLQWDKRDHGMPVVGIRVDAAGGAVATGYIDLFSLEHFAAVYGADRIPQLTANFATGRIEFPRIEYPDEPKPALTAWERLAALWHRIKAKRDRERIEEHAVKSRAMPLTREESEKWEPRCDACTKPPHART